MDTSDVLREPVLDALRAACETYPYLRVCQIIVNATERDDPFYGPLRARARDDDDLANLLRDYAKEREPSRHEQAEAEHVLQRQRLVAALAAETARADALERELEAVLGRCTCPVGFGQVKDAHCARHGRREPAHTITTHHGETVQRRP